MENKTTKSSTENRSSTQTRPVSIRLTADEIAALKQRARTMSISEYVRRQLFNDTVCAVQYDDAERRISPQTSQKLLAQILVRLGKLDSVANVHSLLKALETGLIECSPEFSTKLHATCDEIKGLRSDLLKALGLKPNQ